MTSPGWYSDPQDPNSLRYYDGQAWTEHQQPAGAESGTPAQSQQQYPTQQYPTQQYPTQQYPTQQYPAQQYGQPGQGGQHTQGGRSNKKVPLIIALVVVVVAGLATGGYFLLFNKSSSPEYTFAGKEIKDPATVLDKAEKNVNAIVAKRHGAKSKDTRCYYALPQKPAEGAKDTDVDHDLRCGPVLFVDGDTSQPYLKFALSSEKDGDAVTLTPRAEPESDDPSALASDLTLERPDGVSASKGAGALSVPAPPPAEQGVVLATELTDTTIPAAPDGALMGSYSGGIRLTKLGPVKRYGHGDDARSAPKGQKLIAFQTTGAMGTEEESQDLTSDAEISVDGGPGKSVPETSSGQYVVAAVPADAERVDLVLDEQGLTQTLSLLDGKPGPNNVKVFARSNREVNTPIRANGVLTFKPKVKFADGTAGTSETAKVTINVVELMYKMPPNEKPATASSPSKALMHVSVTYLGAHESGGDFGFPPQLLTFTPDGGSPVKARNMSPREHKIYNVFEVPGDMTSGTLTVSGSMKQSFSSGGGSYRFGIKTPIKMKVSLPLS